MKFQSKASRLEINKELMFKFKFECRGKKKKNSVSAERQSAIRQEELLLSRRESAFLFYIKPKNCRDKNTEDMIRKRYEPTH